MCIVLVNVIIGMLCNEMRYTCEKCKEDYGYISDIQIKCKCEKEHDTFLKELFEPSIPTKKET